MLSRLEESSIGGASFPSLARGSVAFLSAYKRPPKEDDPEEPEELKHVSTHGHLPRIAGSKLRQTISSLGMLEAEQLKKADEQRQDRIRSLLSDMTEAGEETIGAAQFADSFFVQREKSREKALEGSATSAEGKGRHETGDAEDLDASSPVPMEDKPTIESPSRKEEEKESKVLGQLKGLRRASQRVVLQNLLQGGILEAVPEYMAEWKAIQESFLPPPGFRMKVVDVNRTCKGTRSGGLYRFSTMVVVGNGEGVLGWGQGKAAEVSVAIRKAYQRACQTLYPVPRFNNHTITEEVEATFGKVKIIMYPKGAGRGIVASALVRDICKMAGIYDIGVKIHGSRNPRNAVKCLFEAFSRLRTHEEILQARSKGKIIISAPPGRFGKIRA